MILTFLKLLFFFIENFNGSNLFLVIMEIKIFPIRNYHPLFHFPPFFP